MADKVEGVVVSQVDQIGEILGDFAPAAKPADPVVAAPVVAEPAKPVEPVESVKPAEPVVAEPVKDEKDEAIKGLVEQVKALSAKVTELSVAKPTEPAKPAEPAAPVLGMGFFKDKAEYEAAFEKPEVMSEVMARVRTSAVQEVLKSLPQVINNTIKAQLDVQTRTAKFYTDNEDLTAHKQFVGYVANDLSGKNPDWSLDDLFTKLPGEVRARIGLKAVAKKDEGKGPAQPGKKGGARLPGEKPPELNPLETEIADLM